MRNESATVARHVAVRVGAAALAWALVACAGSGKHQVDPPVTPVSTISSTVARSPRRLEFRLVQSTLKYAAATSSATKAPSATSATCENGGLVTRPSLDAPASQVVLADATRDWCYVLGPVLWSAGADVAEANAVLNPTTSGWDLHIRFDNDDFVTKIATPYESQEIAVVVNHVVVSAPTILGGITGRDITLQDGLDQRSADAVAKQLS